MPNWITSNTHCILPIVLCWQPADSERSLQSTTLFLSCHRCWIYLLTCKYNSLPARYFHDDLDVKWQAYVQVILVVAQTTLSCLTPSIFGLLSLIISLRLMLTTERISFDREHLFSSTSCESLLSSSFRFNDESFLSHDGRHSTSSLWWECHMTMAFGLKTISLMLLNIFSWALADEYQITGLHMSSHYTVQKQSLPMNRCRWSHTPMRRNT